MRQFFHRISLIAILSVASTRLPAAATETSAASCASPVNYHLGPNDQISVLVVDLEADFTGKTFTINGTGDVTLPQIGTVHADGLSTSDLEQQIRSRLTRILKDPQVVVSVTTFRTQSVAILGAVNNPGMREIQTGKTLFEALSLAGGLRPDAGYLIRVTRTAACGLLPLPGAEFDPAGRFSTASVKVKDVMNATHPGESNIPVLPGDTISVPKADVVYAIGSVTKSGGFLLDQHESLSALQVLSLAEGLQKTAAPDKAKILRTVEGSPTRTEIPVDLRLLMAGKTTDVQLQAGDILFVPNNNAKSAAYRTLDTITGAAGAALIYAH